MDAAAREPAGQGPAANGRGARQITRPKGLAPLKLPPALHDRLQESLDRQDREGKLSTVERREAKALVELVDMLSLMKLRAQQAPKPGSS